MKLPPLALLPLLAALTSCSCGSAPVTLATPPASTVPAVASSAPSADLAPGATPAGGLQPVLADPRLVTVARLAEASDPGGAAQQLERLLVEAPPSNDDRPRWLYQAARLQAQARRPADAARLYTAAAATPWPLAPYAALGAAQQALAAGRADEAIEQARRAATTATAASPAAGLTEADALEQKGSLAEAVPLWRASLAGLPASKPARWAETSVKLARALLTPGATPPPPAVAEESLGLARRVALEQPASPLAKTALGLEQAALDALPPDRRAALGRRPEDELTRAAALLDAGKATEAESALAAVEAASPPATRSADVACRLTTLRGKILGRRKAQREAALEAWGEATQRCQGEGHLTALFQTANLHATLGHHAEAMGRYEQLEREGPTHRLADDARIKGAQAALALGDEARFTSLLERIDAVYPDGDLTTDGLFRLALHRIEKGDWSGAIAPLEASRRLRPREHDYWAAGRASYFLARALATTGDPRRALTLYEEVMREQPLSYYMALAHARLAEADPARADAVRQSLDRPAVVPTLPAPLDAPQLRTPAGGRAVELLRQGEVELARAEFAAAGLLGSGAPAELQWVVAQLYGSAGAAVLAHTIPRGKVSDWLDRYPVGAWRARWELAYPRPYLPDVEREAKKSGIPTSLAYAIMREESAFDPVVVSSAPAYGLMQFTLDTGKNIGKKLGLAINEGALKTPAVSIALGCRYLADLRARHPASPALAIPSYNAGPGATNRWLTQRPRDDFDLFVEHIPYDETRNYTKRVLKSYAAYLYLYEPVALPEVLRLSQRTSASAAGAPPPPTSPDAEPSVSPTAPTAPTPTPTPDSE